jgi:hypothetical protein
VLLIAVVLFLPSGIVGGLTQFANSRYLKHYTAWLTMPWRRVS